MLCKRFICIILRRPTETHRPWHAKCVGDGTSGATSPGREPKSGPRSPGGSQDDGRFQVASRAHGRRRSRGSSFGPRPHMGGRRWDACRARSEAAIQHGPRCPRWGPALGLHGRGPGTGRHELLTGRPVEDGHPVVGRRRGGRKPKQCPRRVPGDGGGCRNGNVAAGGGQPPHGFGPRRETRSGASEVPAFGPGKGRRLVLESAGSEMRRGPQRTQQKGEAGCLPLCRSPGRRVPPPRAVPGGPGAPRHSWVDRPPRISDSTPRS